MLLLFLYTYWEVPTKRTKNRGNAYLLKLEYIKIFGTYSKINEITY